MAEDFCRAVVCCILTPGLLSNSTTSAEPGRGWSYTDAAAAKKHLLFRYPLCNWKDICSNNPTHSSTISEDFPPYSPACLEACAVFPDLLTQRPLFQVCSKLQLTTKSVCVRKSSFSVAYSHFNVKAQQWTNKTANNLEELLDLGQLLKRTVARDSYFSQAVTRAKSVLLYSPSVAFHSIHQKGFVTKSTGNCSLLRRWAAAPSHMTRLQCQLWNDFW